MCVYVFEYAYVCVFGSAVHGIFLSILMPGAIAPNWCLVYRERILFISLPIILVALK